MCLNDCCESSKVVETGVVCSKYIRCFVVFREKLSNRLLIKTAGDEMSPKVRTLLSIIKSLFSFVDFFQSPSVFLCIPQGYIFKE